MPRKRRKKKARGLLSTFLSWLTLEDVKISKASRGGGRRSKAHSKADDGDLARRLERGEIRGESLAELFRSGKVRLRNPKGGKHGT